MLRTSFRAATLILEKIERHGISLDRAFTEVVSKAEYTEYASEIYKFALAALFHYRAADYILSLNKIQVPLRRKCAFRVGFALLIRKKEFFNFEDLRKISGGLLTGKMLNLLKRIGKKTFEELLKDMAVDQKLGMRYSVPDWLIKRLLRVMSHKELKKLLESTMRPTTWIRINSLKEESKKILKKINQITVVKKDRDYSFMYEVLKGREKLFTSSLVKNGYVIIHDKGSAIVADAILPKKYDIVLDMAAAPGIKTSLIAHMTQNTSRIIALDVSYSRLANMKKLLKLWNVLNVDLILCDSTQMKLSIYPKKIIIDAPCSNTGALASDPGLRLSLNKWRFDIGNLQKIQYSMLEHAIKNTKKGSIIVYSTCSLLPEEGEIIMEKILRKYDVSIDVSRIIGNPGYKSYSISSKVRRLFPHINKTTGFFIARIYR